MPLDSCCFGVICRIITCIYKGSTSRNSNIENIWFILLLLQWRRHRWMLDTFVSWNWRRQKWTRIRTSHSLESASYACSVRKRKSQKTSVKTRRLTGSLKNLPSFWKCFRSKGGDLRGWKGYLRNTPEQTSLSFSVLNPLLEIASLPSPPSASHLRLFAPRVFFFFFLIKLYGYPQSLGKHASKDGGLGDFFFNYRQTDVCFII